MLLAHKIELAPTPEQAAYFGRACGTARMVWNWARAEWNRQYASGQRPTAAALKKQFNASKYADFPWIKDVHRDAHAQPFANLGRAWARFFADLKKGVAAHAPVFKKKGRCIDAFYVANDKLALGERHVKLPLVGAVALKEAPRYGGKVMGANVTRDAGKWFLAVQFEVEVSWLAGAERRPALGVDLNVGAIVCSDGARFDTPLPLKRMTRRITLRQRARTAPPAAPPARRWRKARASNKRTTAGSHREGSRPRITVSGAFAMIFSTRPPRPSCVKPTRR